MKVSDKPCPICQTGHLVMQVLPEAHSYKGRMAQLPLCIDCCDVCGSEQADALLMRRNKRAVMAFRKSVDGLLVGKEVRAIRQRLGISQGEAAKLFGGGPVAFSKYESDDVAQSEAMDKLLRLAVAVPAAFEFLSGQAK